LLASVTDNRRWCPTPAPPLPRTWGLWAMPSAGCGENVSLKPPGDCAPSDGDPWSLASPSVAAVKWEGRARGRPPNRDPTTPPPAATAAAAAPPGASPVPARARLDMLSFVVLAGLAGSAQAAPHAGEGNSCRVGVKARRKPAQLNNRPRVQQLLHIGFTNNVNGGRIWEPAARSGARLWIPSHHKCKAGAAGVRQRPRGCGSARARRPSAIPHCGGQCWGWVLAPTVGRGTHWGEARCVLPGQRPTARDYFAV
jgi:hypothetical protein